MLAGELHEEATVLDRALAVYLRYVEQFPQPVEAAVETHFKIAEIYQRKTDDDALPRAAANRSSRSMRQRAASARSARASWPAVRRSCLHSSSTSSFATLQLAAALREEPEEKQRRMDVATAVVRTLVDYQVGEVTAAATYYMARSTRLQPRAARIGAAGRSRRRELQEYEDALDEEAFPFEEKAIKVYEKNLELMSGIGSSTAGSRRVSRASPS